MAFGRYGAASSTTSQIKQVEANIAMLQSQWTVAKASGKTAEANALEAQIRQQQATLKTLRRSASTSATPASAPDTVPPTVQPDPLGAVTTSPGWVKAAVVVAIVGGLAFATKRR